MSLEVIKATNKEKQIIANLLQIYLSDLCIYFRIDMDQSTGLYIYDDISKYFEDSENKAYLFKYDNELAGFSLIDKVEDHFVVQEIFVLNEFKRKHIGESAINKIFDENRGDWIIKAVPCSKPAEKFWNRVVDKYTNGNFNLEYIGKYNRAVFTFNNSK